MKKRIRHLAQQWLRAARRLEQKLAGRQRDQKHVWGILGEQTGKLSLGAAGMGGKFIFGSMWVCRVGLPSMDTAQEVLCHSCNGHVPMFQALSNLLIKGDKGKGMGSCLEIPVLFYSRKEKQLPV